MANEIDDVELDYELEESPARSVVGADRSAAMPDHAGKIARLLQGSLAGTIRSIVATETVKVLQQSQATAAVKAASTATTALQSPMTAPQSPMTVTPGVSSPTVCTVACAGLPARVKVGGEILESFDPESKECNIERWLGKIDRWALYTTGQITRSHIICRRNYKAVLGSGTAD